MSWVKCKACGDEHNTKSGLIATRRKLCRKCDKEYWSWWDSVKNNSDFRHLVYNTETRRVNYWRDNILKDEGS